MTVTGTVTVSGDNDPAAVSETVEGTLRLELVHPGGAKPSRPWIGRRCLTGMTYKLKGKRLSLRGHKFVKDDPGIDFWADLSTLYVVITEGPPERTYVGVIRVELADFLHRQLRGANVIDGGGPPVDDVGKAWALGRFMSFFMGSVADGYSDWT